MKALVLSGGAGIRSWPSMPTSADPPLSVADKAVPRAVGLSRCDESTITRPYRLTPLALPRPTDVHIDVRRTVLADHGKVRIGS
ncbi:hypothetical protein ACFXPN_41385 [Streptomyces griseorubiginosus]|uniref:hypothetical protein n=1 Tax=Streptomyces griseorubiginosus TaxID=67304 RepID=UPI0036CFAC3A